MKNLLLTSENNENFALPNIIYTAKSHWITYVGPVMGILIGSMGIILLSFGMGWMKFIGTALLLIFGKAVLKVLIKITTKIYLTTDYLTISKGIISKDVLDVPINKLEGIYLTQNLLGKIFNFGTLMVSTGGINQSYVIKNPMELRNKIIK